MATKKENREKKDVDLKTSGKQTTLNPGDPHNRAGILTPIPEMAQSLKHLAMMATFQAALIKAPNLANEPS